MMKCLRYYLLAALCVLAGCSSTPSDTSPKSGYSSAEGGQGYYKVGKPYEVNGNWYTPAEDYSYDETGVASWYGKEFHGGMTANGEQFNKNELTAAHKTLPLPTLARVTNLDNGRSIVVRINDRGPFSGSRLIDVSQRSAQLLGFEGTGTAKVRVQVLADESKAIADAMRHYGGNATAVASNTPAATQQTQPAQPEVLASNVARETPATALALPNAEPAEPEEKIGNVETKTLEPIKTTPAIHRELLKTQPVAEVVQLPVTGAHQIFVQAGAFTVLENAQKMQQSLASYGNPAVSDISVNGETFHRVRFGPLADVTQADQLLAKLHKAGIANLRTTID